MVTKTKPLEQWRLSRLLRERIKAELDREGIEVPPPTPWNAVGQPASASFQPAVRGPRGAASRLGCGGLRRLGSGSELRLEPGEILVDGFASAELLELAVDVVLSWGERGQVLERAGRL